MRDEYDVVVVGAGAAGLTTACALARAGVEVLLLERRPAGSPLPRATVLSVRTMELMRSWGLEDRIREGADVVEMTMREASTAARVADGVSINVGYPSRGAERGGQPDRGSLRRPGPPRSGAGGVPVLDAGGDRAARCRGAGGPRGRPGRGRAPDGARRRADGSARSGPASSSRADGARSAVRDVARHRHDRTRRRDGGHPGRVPRAAVGRARGAPAPAVLAHRPGGQRDPGARRPGRPVDLRVAGRLPLRGRATSPRPTRSAAGSRRLRACRDSRCGSSASGSFSSGAQLADTFRAGDVFLVGDAAHRVTPRGGTGLNIAIADGWNLGWKLAWVMCGWAPATLLSTYEPERRAAVAYNVERSADPLGSRRDVSTELAVDLGGRIQHVWVGPDDVSTLDLVGPGLTLFTGCDERILGGCRGGAPVAASRSRWSRSNPSSRAPSASARTAERWSGRTACRSPRGAARTEQKHS